MSDNIPFSIQVEIIKRVAPVKSLLRFRSVSKQWKSLIDSAEFINHHSVQEPHRHHLLVSSYEIKFASIVDDGRRCTRMLMCSHIGFPILKGFTPVLINSSHGLVCLIDSLAPATSIIILWNPSIQKSLTIQLPYARDYFGFGVCPEPKILKLAPVDKTMVNVDYTAELFTLTSGAWRSVSVNLSLKQLVFVSKPVAVDSIIYWLASSDGSYRIISFDFTREEFGQVDLPDTPASPDGDVSISKIYESLAVLNARHVVDSEKPVCDVWMMLKNGSFTKLFTVKASPCMIRGFKKNGQPIVEYICPDRLTGKLHVYDPSSEHILSLEIYGLNFTMASYTESLLLLNHPDSISTVPPKKHY